MPQTKAKYLVVMLGTHWAAVKVLDKNQNPIIARPCIPATTDTVKKGEKVTSWVFNDMPYIDFVHEAVVKGEFADGQNHKHTLVPCGEARGNCFSNAARYIQEGYWPSKRNTRGYWSESTRKLPSSDVAYKWTRKSLEKWITMIGMGKKMGLFK